MSDNSRRTQTPFGPGVPLGRIFGVPVLAHWSVLAALLLVTLLLADAQLPGAVPGRSPALYWSVGAVGAVLFVASIVVHELAHAVVARRVGIKVRRMTVWMLGGLTELEGEAPTPKADALVAAAGPAATVLLGLLFGGGAVLVGTGGVVGATLAWLASMSALLAVFNLLPAAPLDGGRLLRAAVWRITHDRARGNSAATTSGAFVGTALIVLGFLSVLAGAFGGLWLGLVGWFILTGAQSERSTVRPETMAGLVAADVMVPAPRTCPHWWTVAGFVATLGPADSAQSAFPLVDLDGRAVGAVTVTDLARIPATRAVDLAMRDVRGRRAAIPLVPEQLPLDEVLKQLRGREPVAVVTGEGGRPVGVVEVGTIARVLRMRQLSERVGADRTADQPALQP